MDPRRLRYFIHVAEFGSFTKAAEALTVVQPALSQQIAHLENQLGMALFHRTGRGVVLTDAGMEFLPRAQLILDEIDRVKDEMQLFRATPSGKITLGVPPSVSHFLVSSFVLQMRKSFPEIQLSIVEGSSGFIREWLSKGRVDIGILYNVQPDPSISREMLLVEDLFLVGPSDDQIVSAPTVAFERLMELPLILPGRPHGLRMLIDRIGNKKGVTLPAVLELDGMSLIRDLVASRCGYTILPYAAVYYEVESGTLRCAKITDPEMTRTMVMASSAQRRLSVATREATRILREQVQKLTLTEVQ